MRLAAGTFDGGLAAAGSFVPAVRAVAVEPENIAVAIA